MKAILVVDIPDDKKYANDKWFIEGEEIGIRNMTEKGEFGEYYKEIDDWEKLELNPIPIKQDTKAVIGIDLVEGFKDGWNYGWNACIETILGEEDVNKM